MKKIVRKYEGDGHHLTLKGLDARYADQIGLNVLHKLVRFPELSIGEPKFKVTIEILED